MSATGRGALQKDDRARTQLNSRCAPRAMPLGQGAVSFQFTHMATEEQHIRPLAEQFLTDDGAGMDQEWALVRGSAARRPRVPSHPECSRRGSPSR